MGATRQTQWPAPFGYFLTVVLGCARNKGVAIWLRLFTEDYW